MTRKSKKFDKFMLDVHHAANPKIARLTDGEYRAHIGGILPLAALAPVRGRLLVGDEQVTAEDVARKAGVNVKVAKTCMDKLRRLGVLIPDEELACEQVHDWDEWQTKPKDDPTNAARQARYRERRNARNAPSNAPSNGVTRNGNNAPVTDTKRARAEEEEEVKTPLGPPKGGHGGKVVKFARKTVPPGRLHLAEQILDVFNDQARTSYEAYTGTGNPSESLKRIIGALTEHPDLTLDEAKAMMRWQFAHPFWEGRPHPGVVFGPGVFERVRATAATRRTPAGGSIADRLEAEQRRLEQVNSDRVAEFRGEAAR